MEDKDDLIHTQIYRIPEKRENGKIFEIMTIFQNQWKQEAQQIKAE